MAKNAPVQTAPKTISPGVGPVARAFLQKLEKAGGPPLFELPIQEAREVLLKLQSDNTVKLPADFEDRIIPGGPNGQISIRIVRPKGHMETLPIVMYFHGGGWVLGDRTTHDRLIRKLANGVEAAVVFVNFTPSPEAHYPVALEEAYAATQWIEENGPALNLDVSHIAVAGDSAGGNLAAALALLAKERGTPHIGYQALFYPVTDANFDTDSYHQFAEGYYLTRESMRWFWDQYAPDFGVRDEPTASPLRASLGQLRDLPPALIITGEYDVLRDEGEAYAHKLLEAGVEVTALRCLGIVHDFVMLNALSETPAAKAALNQANYSLRRALGR